MVKKLGNTCLLIGLLCLVLFFSSSGFLVDQPWFFMGGIGLIALGLLIKRWNNMKGDRWKRTPSSHRKDREVNDESS